MSAGVAARLLHSVLGSLPVQHGMVRVSGVARDPSSQTEAHDVVVDARGEISVFLLALQRAEPGARIGDAVVLVRDALLSRAPLYEIIAALRTFCADAERQAVLGVTLLRFAQPDSRVEVLVAGSPAVVCAGPGGIVTHHAPLSPAVGSRAGEVHPYELSPLLWGSTWFLLSGALTEGSLDPNEARRRVVEHELDRAGPDLSGLTPEELEPWLTRLQEGPANTEGRLLVVHADPTRRFESGIR